MRGQPQAGEAAEPRVRPYWRRRVVLLAVAEGIVVVALAVFVGRLLWPQKPRARPSATSSLEPEPPSPSSMPVAAATAHASAPPTPSPSPVVAVAPSTSASGGPKIRIPDHVAELDAFFDLPEDFKSWTPERRKAYFDDAMRKLDDKDRSLRRELDLATRRGDTETAEQLAITLEHFRARGGDIRRIYTPDAAQ
jgi:hypothetical protein